MTVTPSVEKDSARPLRRYSTADAVMAGPVLVGSFQLTSRLVSEFAVGRTVGWAGAVGISVRSVTLIATLSAALAPAPSEATTVT